MATVFLTERLMKAAEAVIAQQEPVEVVYVGPGERRMVRLSGRGEQPRTARLSLWTPQAVIEGRHAVKFSDVLLPRATAQRLEQIACEQSGPQLTEWERTMRFIASAKQRTRDGRFADVVHRAERAGTR